MTNDYVYKIAIIEDSVPTNDEFKTFLLDIWPNCHVEQFVNFETASAALSSTTYDLIVSDIDLGPGSDKFGGMKIAKALHSKNTPLLIVSGSPQPELNRNIFRALDAWDYLQKPVTGADFRNQVKRAIAYRLTQTHPETKSNSSTTLVGDPDLVIDLHSRVKVTWKGDRVHLPMTQVRLVETLVRHVNTPAKYDELYEQIDSGRNKENLRVHIGAIRTAFREVDSTFDQIRSVTMIGYLWRV